jgi:Ca2+-binding RTX toxin-like protein
MPPVSTGRRHARRAVVSLLVVSAILSAAPARADSDKALQLSVDRIGRGGGSVTSSPAGITCGGDCVQSYSEESTVALSATPDATSSFAGWKGGGCSGSGTCKVTLESATTVSATFEVSDDCTIVGTGGKDVLVGTSMDDVICGLGGDDVLWGLWGADSLIGGDGDDVMIGGGSDDAIDGRGGIDTAAYRRISPWRLARFHVTVDLLAGFASGTVIGRDRLIGVERAVGTIHADVLLGSDHADQLIGRAGTDTVAGRDGDDVLFGGWGDDVIAGGPGDDVLEGGDGVDRLFGGSGLDRAHGGAGADRISGAESP